MGTKPGGQSHHRSTTTATNGSGFAPHTAHHQGPPSYPGAPALGTQNAPAHKPGGRDSWMDRRDPVRRVLPACNLRCCSLLTCASRSRTFHRATGNRWTGKLRAGRKKRRADQGGFEWDGCHLDDNRSD